MDMEKDHLEYAQRHIFSKDERRHLKAYAHAMIAVGQELRKINNRAKDNPVTTNRLLSEEVEL